MQILPKKMDIPNWQFSFWIISYRILTHLKCVHLRTYCGKTIVYWIVLRWPIPRSMHYSNILSCNTKIVVPVILSATSLQLHTQLCRSCCRIPCFGRFVMQAVIPWTICRATRWKSNLKHYRAKQ